MILTMILAGLIVGRWWAIPLSGLAWLVLLIATGADGPSDSIAWSEGTTTSGGWGAIEYAGVVLLAALNAAAGLALRGLGRALYRAARRRNAP